MTQIDSTEIKKQRTLAIIWSVTFLILFPVMIILGLLMRLKQGDVATSIEPTTFYSYMTMHGLGMAGILFSISFAALWYLNSTRIVKLNLKFGYFHYALIVIGTVGLLIGTLIGKYGAGWYMLYPLPFKMPFWSSWALKLSIISLIILGTAWLLGILHILYVLAKEYGGVSKLLGWQYIGKKEVKRELPPLVLITTVSLIPGVFALITGAAMLIMYLLQAFEPSLSFDALLMKNMVMFFGHTLVNITMYCIVGSVYAILPEYTGREWKTNNVLVYSWNATLIFITFAYFHHLYMDFSQPLSLQYFGQIISYSSAIPATAITMFGVIAQIYRAKMKWSIVPLSFLFGMVGWAIGGFAAVVDSTIALNNALHNTLWVPAHFHTYMLLGVVLFIFGYLFYIFPSKDDVNTDTIAKAGFWTFVAGGYGFVLMFYLGGFFSIPRRYATYTGIPIERTHTIGALLAVFAASFVVLLLIGLLIMYSSLFIRLLKKKENVLVSEDVTV